MRVREKKHAIESAVFFQVDDFAFSNESFGVKMGLCEILLVPL